MEAPPDPLVIRPASPDEFDDIRAVVASAYGEFEPVVAEITEAGSEALWAAYLADLMDLDARIIEGGELLVGDAGGPIAGVVTFYADAAGEGLGWPNGWAGFRALAVDPLHRGAGVGRLLVDACLDRARAAGAPVVSIHTADFMTAAIAIYERAGFRRCPEYDLKSEELLGVDGARGPAVIAYRLDLAA